MIADRFEGVERFCSPIWWVSPSTRHGFTPAAMVEYLKPAVLGVRRALRASSASRRSRPSAMRTWPSPALPDPGTDPSAAIAKMALGMIDRLDRVNGHFGWSLQIRIGNTIPVPWLPASSARTASIYDVWGRYRKCRQPARGPVLLPNRIHVPQDTAPPPSSVPSRLEPRGSIDVKGKRQTGDVFS